MPRIPLLVVGDVAYRSMGLFFRAMLELHAAWTVNFLTHFWRSGRVCCLRWLPEVLVRHPTEFRRVLSQQSSSLLDTPRFGLACGEIDMSQVAVWFLQM